MGSTESGQVETFAITANSKLFLLTGRIQPFLLVGFGLAHSKIEDSLGLGYDDDATGFAARLGGGVDIYLTEQIALWAKTTYLANSQEVDTIDINYVSFGAGLQLRFEAPSAS